MIVITSESHYAYACMQTNTWTGAGCVTYNLTSDGSSTSTDIVDYGAFYLGHKSTSLVFCSKNCSKQSTVSLDPSKYYAFNTSNSGRNGVWSALDYVLHPSNSTSELY